MRSLPCLVLVLACEPEPEPEPDPEKDLSCEAWLAEGNLCVDSDCEGSALVFDLALVNEEDEVVETPFRTDTVTLVASVSNPTEAEVTLTTYNCLVNYLAIEGSKGAVGINSDCFSTTEQTLAPGEVLESRQRPSPAGDFGIGPGRALAHFPTDPGPCCVCTSWVVLP